MGNKEIKLCALQPIEIDLVTNEVKISSLLIPNSEFILKDINLPFDPKEHSITMVLYDLHNRPLSFADSLPILFISTKEDNYEDSAKSILQNKLSEMKLRMIDIFCTCSSGFVDVIRPKLQPVPNSNAFSYCILDDL